MNTNRITQGLSGILGALIAILVCALGGVNFSSHQESAKESTQQNVLMGQSPTSLDYQVSEVSQLRTQIQRLQSQLSFCEMDASRLRMDALMNQNSQQRR